MACDALNEYEEFLQTKEVALLESKNAQRTATQQKPLIGVLRLLPQNGE